ncbi:hypothetical protein BB558_005349 [Smittium angustum]|uniref:NIPSNAP domain-containing protein n=1 Tax=Smittium angustum TaxID=133377 RepID=A0A2U1J0Q9_SMIAN|nr:hypothetical protein BB558_005349 [Smittium angustum]
MFSALKTSCLKPNSVLSSLCISNAQRSFTTTLKSLQDKGPKVEPPQDKDSSGFISQLLYGSKPGTESGAQDATGFKRFARDKYDHELIVHKVKPGYMDEYVELVTKLYPKIANDHYPRVKLTGSWSTIVGDVDSAVHIWEYQGYNEMQEFWAHKKANPELKKAEQEIAKLLVSRNTQLIQEFSFCPTSPPIVTNGIYELRTYTLKPGNLLSWQEKWFDSISKRATLSRLKGAWYSKEGVLNQVHHIWAYESLLERKNSRKSAWADKSWAKSANDRMPLTDHMDSIILEPMSFSPLH